MLVFWKERLVFLATPKTGSTAIEAALEPLANLTIQRPPELKHTSMRRYQQYLAPYLFAAANEEFTVVALMREPISWLGSRYRYRQRDGVQREELSTAGISFEEFVGAYLGYPTPEFAAVGDQSGFLSADDATKPPRIFRYEKIDSFVAFLEDRLSFEITLPRLNVSPKGNLDLSPQTEARLRTAMAADFDLYASLG